MPVSVLELETEGPGLAVLERLKELEVGKLDVDTATDTVVWSVVSSGGPSTDELAPRYHPHTWNLQVTEVVEVDVGLL